MNALAQDTITWSIDRGVGRIYLNRPKALNALNLEMIQTFSALLDAWRHNPAVEAVLITSTSEKAFCAGGDLRTVHEANKRGDDVYLESLFRSEYAANYAIRSYPKPYVSFINGIAMGGGLGASLHGDLAVVSERALLAMPEVNIGYFPDVGAGHFLNQSPLHQGFYLGLTGHHFGPREAIEGRIAQFYIESEQHPAVIEGLLDLPQKDRKTIEAYLQRSHQTQSPSEVFKRVAFMEDLLSLPSFLDFWTQIKTLDHPEAALMVETLKKRSPSAVAITWYQLKRCRGRDFKTIMQYEFSLSRAFMKIPDFVEGIRATIIDKDQAPCWEPASIEALSHQKIEEILSYMDVIPLDV